MKVGKRRFLSVLLGGEVTAKGGKLRKTGNGSNELSEGRMDANNDMGRCNRI